MANRISGITIEFEGNTTKLADSLKKVNKDLRQTQEALKDVDKLLKVDPKNVELLAQKQTLLNRAIDDVNKKLEAERDALQKLEAGEQTEETIKQQEALRREIVDNEQQLAKYQAQLSETEKALGEDAEATGDLTKEMDDGGKQSKTFGDMLKANLASEAIIAGIKAMANAVKQVAEAIGEAITSSAQFADDINTLSKTTGLSTETLQEYQYMANLVDVDLNTVTGSLTKLTRNMSSARDGSGAAAEAFEALGISITDANGNLRDNEEVFKEVIDALGSIENETERDAVAMSIFGKSAQELNPMIIAGSDALDAFAQEAHDVGYVMDQETLNSLNGLNDMFDRAKLAGEALANQFAASLAPTLSDLGDTTMQMLSDIDMDTVFKQIGDIMGELGTTIAEILPTLIDLFHSCFEILTPILDMLTPLLQMILKLLEPIIQLINVLLPPIIALLMQVFEKLTNFLYPIITAITTFITDKVVPAVQKVIEWVQNVYTKVTEVIPKVRDTIKEKIQEAVNFLKGLPGEALQWGKDLLQSFIDGIAAKIQSLVSTISNVASTVRSYIHFTEPDVGPLSDFNSYGPDMIETFSKGIIQSLPELQRAMGQMAGTIAGGLAFNPNAQVTQTLTMNNNDLLGAVGSLGDQLSSGLGGLSRLGIYLDGKTLVGYVNRNMGAVYGG